jgi:hypothetical protein
MIKRLHGFGLFWYDFLVGDDWRVALGVVVALAATLVVTNTTHIAAWWIVPVAVASLLPLSVRRVARAVGSARSTAE